MTCDGCGEALTVGDLAARGQARQGRAAAVLAAVPARWMWCGECLDGAWFLLCLDVARRQAAAARGEAA